MRVDIVDAAGITTIFTEELVSPAVAQSIADETGGRFYSADTVEGLPEDLRYTGAGVTVVEEKDLWDMPALLGLIVLLVGVEWTLRRQWGFA